MLRPPRCDFRRTMSVMAARKKRVPASDIDMAAEMRPGFAAAADAARKAILAGKYGM